MFMNSNENSLAQAGGRKVASVGVPIYKRLEYLPSVLKMVGAQDYPAVELFVSDNGENGSKVRDIIQEQYRRPYRFRQNPKTVDISVHFNQIIQESRSEYFVMLNDDDEISPNYISELVAQMEKYPDATIAFGRQEIINKEGVVLRTSKGTFPPFLSGAEFIRATWKRYEFGFENVESFMAKTKLLQDTGGYEVFARGNHSDDAAVIRCCLGHSVVFSSKCTYRHRVHEGGFGWLASMDELAAATREFIYFLDRDPVIRAYAQREPQEWADLKELLATMSWETYLWRWKDLYKQQLSTWRWVRAGFAMPYIPAYYQRVWQALKAAAKARVKSWIRSEPEKAYDFFQSSTTSTDPAAKNR
jgi:glycosyltransferase involved in cell wall biosynthesis